MPKRIDIKSVLIIGAGPIVIGQAASLITAVLKHVRHSKEEGLRVF